MTALASEAAVGHVRFGEARPQSSSRVSLGITVLDPIREGPMPTPSAKPCMWFPGATWGSVVVLSLFSLFMAGLFVASLLKHADHQTRELTGMGAATLAVLALVQVSMLRKDRRS
jgi:hypothetical protein